MTIIFRTRQLLIAPTPKGPRPRMTSICRLISTTSPNHHLNRHKFFVYAPDKTDQGTFQRRLSVRPKHLVRSTQMFESGFISTWLFLWFPASSCLRWPILWCRGSWGNADTRIDRDTVFREKDDWFCVDNGSWKYRRSAEGYRRGHILHVWCSAYCLSSYPCSTH